MAMNSLQNASSSPSSVLRSLARKEQSNQELPQISRQRPPKNWLVHQCWGWICWITNFYKFLILGEAQIWEIWQCFQSRPSHCHRKPQMEPRCECCSQGKQINRNDHNLRPTSLTLYLYWSDPMISMISQQLAICGGGSGQYIIIMIVQLTLSNASKL